MLFVEEEEGKKEGSCCGFKFLFWCFLEHKRNAVLLLESTREVFIIIVIIIRAFV